MRWIFGRALTLKRIDRVVKLGSLGNFILKLKLVFGSISLRICERWQIFIFDFFLLAHQHRAKSLVLNSLALELIKRVFCLFLILLNHLNRIFKLLWEWILFYLLTNCKYWNSYSPWSLVFWYGPTILFVCRSEAMLGFFLDLKLRPQTKISSRLGAPTRRRTYHEIWTLHRVMET